MRFTERLLARASGEVATVRPRPHTWFDPERAGDPVPDRSEDRREPPAGRSDPPRTRATPRPPAEPPTQRAMPHTTPRAGSRSESAAEPRPSDEAPAAGPDDARSRTPGRNARVVRDESPRLAPGEGRPLAARPTPTVVDRAAAPVPEGTQEAGDGARDPVPAPIPLRPRIRHRLDHVETSRDPDVPRAQNRAADAAPASTQEPAARRGSRHDSGQVIRIHIGRIEVRAQRESAPPARPQRPRQTPGLTLDEYARQRARGER